MKSEYEGVDLRAIPFNRLHYIHDHVKESDPRKREVFAEWDRRCQLADSEIGNATTDDPGYVKIMPLEEYNRLVNHNSSLNKYTQELLNVIAGLLLERNTERVTINQRNMLRAADFRTDIRHFVKQIEVQIVHKSVAVQQAPESD